jgi:hypothetical protein
LVATSRWPNANPWTFSSFAGVLFFFIGWWGMGRMGSGVGAGLIWGVGFFAVTAINLRRHRTKAS